MNGMTRRWWGLGIAGIVLLAATVGCKSPSGSREFIPGKGWRSTGTSSQEAGGLQAGVNVRSTSPASAGKWSVASVE